MRTSGIVLAALAPVVAFAHELPAAHAHVENAPAVPVSGAIAVVLVALVPIAIRAAALLRARAAR